MNRLLIENINDLKDSSEENGIKKPTAPQHRPRSRPNRGINSPPRKQI